MFLMFLTGRKRGGSVVSVVGCFLRFLAGKPVSVQFVGPAVVVSRNLFTLLQLCRISLSPCRLRFFLLFLFFLFLGAYVNWSKGTATEDKALC